MRKRTVQLGNLLVGLLLVTSVGSAGSVIPKPLNHVRSEGAFEVGPETAIITDRETSATGRLLAGRLRQATGHALPVLENEPARDDAIIFTLDAAARNLGGEGYRLVITPRRITVRALQPAGAFYGSITLQQLLPPDLFSERPAKGVAWTIPCGRIEDRPRFGWRGALIDVARYYQPKAELLKFIDLLALHKMNSLQLHLTDDQGWRIEIRKYPRLTEVGSLRKETLVGHHNDKPMKFDGKPHGGFYTQEELREIVAYAEARFINVVPEIEMPGHAQAAITAYPKLGNVSEPLELRTFWGVSKNIFNVNEETILFLQDVLDEVMEIFPSRYIHVGGDEVPKDQWKESAAAQARRVELGLKDEKELHGYFIRRMDAFLTSRGRRLVGWDEILEGGLAPGAVVMSWHGVEGGIAAARARHDCVMAPLTHTYFDYYQSLQPGEPLAMCCHIPLEKVYGYEPVPAELSAEEAKHVLGLQGQLWTEYMPTEGILEYMAFPRLTALAEVAWSAAEEKDYEDFLERLLVHEERLSGLRVNFRPVGEN
jgi:hexosaminidase